MDFNEFQKLAARTANLNLEMQTRISVAFLGLCGESGEAAEIWKKFLGHGHALSLANLKKELGDCLWYLAEICTCLGFDFVEIAEAVIEKLRARYPEKFSEELSINREEYKNE